MARSTQNRANANRSQDFIEDKKILDSSIQSRGLDIFQPKPIEKSDSLDKDQSSMEQIQYQGQG
jgi:hypothetical protein